MKRFRKFLACGFAGALAWSGVGVANAVSVDLPPDTEQGETLVAGGFNAAQQDASWVAYLAIANHDGTNMVCTGSLISPEWVITAGHCVARNPRFVNVAMGVNREQRYPVDKVVVNQQPNTDLALLHLHAPVSGITPVIIDPGLAPVGATATYYGWGGSHGGLQGNTQGIQAHCHSQLDSDTTTFTSSCDPTAPGPLSYKVSGGINVSEHGDSGGPLVVNGRLVGTLIGAINDGSFFVVLQSHLAWISQNTGITPGQQVPAAENYPFEGNVARIYGNDRIRTALELFTHGTYSGNAIVVATGKRAPDALAASALAGVTGAPILLTNQTNQLEPEVFNAIVNSGKKQVYFLGGGVGVNPDQAAAFNQNGISAQTIAGVNREATAIGVARAARAASKAANFDIFLVRGWGDPNLPDALSVGAVAAAKNGVILFVGDSQIAPETQAAIRELSAQATEQGGSARAIVVGGGAVRTAQASGLTPEAASSFGLTGVEYIYGGDRYATAVMVMQSYLPVNDYLVASGVSFPDGLAASGYAVSAQAGLLLVGQNTLPGSVANYIRAHASGKYTLVGGPKAISRQVANNIGSLLSVE